MLYYKLKEGNNVEEKITLDMLTTDSVSIKKQNYTTVDGIEYPVGDPWRRAYINSSSGRTALQAEVANPYKTAIMAVWGDTPTVTDPE